MRNFIQPGKVLTAVAPAGGVISGKLYKFGLIFGVAATTALEGQKFELAVGEVYEVPKVAGEAWTFGAAIYMDASGIATTVATSNTKIGVAVDAAGVAAGVGSALVRLNDVF